MPDHTSVYLRAVGTYQNNEHGEYTLQTESLHIDQLATFFDESAKSTSPEELLLSAAAGCYLITLKTLLINREIAFSSIELNSEALIVNDGGSRFDSIVHRPIILLEQSADEAEVRVLAAHAEHTCMVSCALRGNVTVCVEPTVLIQAAHSS